MNSAIQAPHTCAMRKARGVARTSQGVFWGVDIAGIAGGLLARVSVDGVAGVGREGDARAGFKWQVVKIRDRLVGADRPSVGSSFSEKADEASAWYPFA